MKKNLLILAAALFIAATGSVSAQSTAIEQQKERRELYKQRVKERQENAKASKKELNEKATKTARKEAKKLEKDGWKSAPGALPIDRQLDKSYTMQYSYDSNGFPQYYMSEGMSVGGSYDAAKVQALEIAKQNLAGEIQTEITGLIDNSVANSQMDDGDAASLVKTVAASKSLISQSLKRITPIVELYRETSNGKKEVLVRIAYSSEMANAAAKDAIVKELGDKSEELHGKLDKILGW